MLASRLRRQLPISRAGKRQPSAEHHQAAAAVNPLLDRLKPIGKRDDLFLAPRPIEEVRIKMKALRLDVADHHHLGSIDELLELAGLQPIERPVGHGGHFRILSKRVGQPLTVEMQIAVLRLQREGRLDKHGTDVKDPVP